MNILRNYFSTTWSLVQLACIAAVLAGCSGKGNGGENCGGYGGCNPSATTGAPTVAIGAVPQTSKGAVTLTATVPSAANGIASVDFLVDNASIGPGTAVVPATTPPSYTVGWESTMVADGTHSVEVRVTDAKGLVSFATAPTIVANAVLVSMSPVEEGPSVTGTVATGTGTVNANMVTGVVTATIVYSNFKDAGGAAVLPTLSHFHQAFAGNAGPVIVNLANTTNTYFCGAAACTAAQTLTGTNPSIPPAAAPTFSATVTNIVSTWTVSPAAVPLTPSQRTVFRAGGFYLNVHSARFPAGELRSQVKPANIRTIFVNMDSSQEVPPVTVPSTATGFGAVTVDTVSRAVVVELHATGVDTSNIAHIHTGAAGAAGPILVNFVKDPLDPTHWSTDPAAVSTVTAGDVANFNNSLWYLNVHNLAGGNPGGEIRGQVNSNIFVAQLSSTNEVPPIVGLTYSGAVTVTVDTLTLEACVRGSTQLPANVADTIVASHIHRGAAGTNGLVVINFGTNLGNSCVTVGPINDTTVTPNVVLTPTVILNGLFGIPPTVTNGPANHYYNYHTTTYPGGAGRGQLAKGP